MDSVQYKAILDKFGKENCVQIIFDNGRVWLTKRPKLSEKPAEAMRGIVQKDENGHTIFYSFDELVELDEATESIKIREFQQCVNFNSKSKMWWWICTPLENIQGFSFLPKVGEHGITEEEIKVLADNWDHTIV